MGKIQTVEEYIVDHPKWEAELKILRDLFRSYPLEESIKWGSPAYSFEGKNLFGLGAFKNHFGIWLFQGGLLQKNTSLLTHAQEGKTKAMRQIKFSDISEINKKELAKYIEENIQLVKQGKQIKKETKKEVEIPAELKKEFKNDADLYTSFQNLTPGKQREYAEYISQAKREETKLNRLEKIIPMIKEGKGLNDKYQK